MPDRLQFVRGLIALAMFGVVIEVCARVDDYVTYGAPLLATYNNENMYTRDRLGKKGKPYARYRKWGLNALGLRGPDLKPGGFRILCFGASETFGLYEREGFEYPRQLEAMLNQRAGEARFQVVNAAYAGLSPLTASLRVPEIVAATHPKLALIYSAPAEYIWLPWVALPKPAPVLDPPQPFELRIEDRAYWLLKGVVPEAVQNFVRRQETARDAAQYQAMDRLPEENVKRYRGDILTLACALRERGVMPVLVTHLSAFGLAATPDQLSPSDRRLLSGWRKFYPMLKEAGFLDMETRMNQEVRALGLEENIAVIDIARQYPVAPGNFRDFVHFSDEGARKMAALLAADLQPVLAHLESR